MSRKRLESSIGRRQTSHRAGRLGSLRTLDIENHWLRVRILPEVGAKIYDLIWKPTGRNILWHNPRVEPQAYAIDSEFDNYWCGGWDDAFPTADACIFQGQRYPDLGELRSLRWTVESTEQTSGGAIATLFAFGPISPVRAVKTIILARESPTLTMRYEITNLGPTVLDFLWGTHPAVMITPHTILRVPATHGIVGQCNDLAYGRTGQRYTWPVLQADGRKIRMDKVRPFDANLLFGHYATELKDGWYSIENTQSGEGFLVVFPVELCPYLWLWLNYGGWRGHYHVIVEPWTGFPVNLAKAYELKRTRCIKSAESFSVEVKATIYNRPETWREALARLR